MLGDIDNDFKKRLDRAIKNMGNVRPFLNKVSLMVLGVKHHEYHGSWSEAQKAAVNDAIPCYNNIQEKNGKIIHNSISFNYDNFGMKFSYVISTTSLYESINPSQIKRSSQNGVTPDIHLSLLKHLNKIINNSIEVEEHPDLNKDSDGIRSWGNGINPDYLIHRFIGAVRLDGVLYRVKTTMKEAPRNDPNNAHHYAYDVAKIEILNEERSLSISTGWGSALKPEVIPATKVIKDLEKSYDPGKKILDESRKLDRRIAIKRATAAGHKMGFPKKNNKKGHGGPKF